MKKEPAEKSAGFCLSRDSCCNIIDRFEELVE